MLEWRAQRRCALLTSLPVFLVCLAVTSLPAHADTKVLTAEATYTMGEGETMTFAEAMTLQKAKQTALEQAGTYVESYTKIQNYTLTADEIQTIAGGVLQVEVLEKKRELIGDGLKFFVRIKATVTTDKVAELAERIKGRSVEEEYKKLQKEYASLNKEIESLKLIIARTPPGPEREMALERIQAQGKAFFAVQKNEAAFYQKLVSGEKLAKEASTQLTRKMTERETVEALFQWIMTSGYQITVGEPSIKTSLDNPQRASVTIPISMTLTSEARNRLAAAAEQLGGDATSLRPFGSDRGGCKKTVLIASRLILARDPETQAHFKQLVASQMLVIEGLSRDGTVLFQQSLPVLPQSVSRPDMEQPGSPFRCFNFYVMQEHVSDGSGRWQPRWAPIVINESRTASPAEVFLLEDTDRMSLTWNLSIEKVRPLNKLRAQMILQLQKK